MLWRVAQLFSLNTQRWWGKTSSLLIYWLWVVYTPVLRWAEAILAPQWYFKSYCVCTYSNAKGVRSANVLNEGTIKIYNCVKKYQKDLVNLISWINGVFLLIRCEFPETSVIRKEKYVQKFIVLDDPIQRSVDKLWTNCAFKKIKGVLLFFFFLLLNDCRKILKI